MQCVILVAGRGTRMGALTNDVPKPMISILGLPLLAHKINMLPKTIEEVVLVVGYKKENIMQYFGTQWNGRMITYVEQTDLNGTAGAIHLVKNKVHGKFLVTMGDDLYFSDDMVKIAQHPLALLSYYTRNASQFGLVTTDKQHNLLAVIERPHALGDGLVNTGAYVLNEDFFEYTPVKISETEYGLPQTLVAMSQDRPIRVEITKTWLPINSPDYLVLAERFLLALES